MEIVSEVYGVMVARGVAGGFVETSGSFTAGATACAAKRNVQLIAGTHASCDAAECKSAQVSKAEALAAAGESVAPGADLGRSGRHPSVVRYLAATRFRKAFFLSELGAAWASRTEDRQ